MPPKVSPISLDGFRIRDRMLVCYESGENRWHHDRILLAQVDTFSWVVATPHWDVYIEDLREYIAVYKQGDRGGVGPSLFGVRRVKFDQAELVKRLPELLEMAEDAAARERPAAFNVNSPAPEGTGHVPGPNADTGVVWLAMEDRGGYNVGGPVVINATTVVAGDRALFTTSAGEIVALAKEGTFSVPEGGDDLRTLPVRYSDKEGTLRSRPFASAVVASRRTNSPIGRLMGHALFAGCLMRWLRETRLHFEDIFGGVGFCRSELRTKVSKSTNFLVRFLSAPWATTSCALLSWFRSNTSVAVTCFGKSVTHSISKLLWGLTVVAASVWMQMRSVSSWGEILLNCTGGS